MTQGSDDGFSHEPHDVGHFVLVDLWHQHFEQILCSDGVSSQATDAVLLVRGIRGGQATEITMRERVLCILKGVCKMKFLTSVQGIQIVHPLASDWAEQCSIP